jgi:hypothetical protein
MKSTTNISLLLFLMFALAVGSGASQETEPLMMRGTEQPVSHRSDETGSCIIFSKYVIQTGVSDEGGEDLTVYTRGGERGCSITRKPILHVPNEDNNALFGIAGKWLFVDSGTSVESRGLEIYDLETGKPVIGVEYSDEPKLEGGRYVVYDAPSEKPGPISSCREAAKWKREGGGVGWVQTKRLDLDTLKQTTVGTLRCIYMQ